MIFIRIAAINDALKTISMDKFLRDRYFDISDLLFDRGISRSAVRNSLLKSKPFFAPLFDKMPPSDRYKNKERAEEELYNLWEANVGSLEGHFEFTEEEAKYIVLFAIQYIKATQSNARCEDYLLSAFEQMVSAVDEYASLEIKYIDKQAIIFDANRIEIKCAKTVPDFLTIVMEEAPSQNDIKVFFRGHSLLNYSLIPSIMRKDSKTGTYKLFEKEQYLYNEIQYKCPEDFDRRGTHLEKLTIMQHYGLPTRLLDITANPLVALYLRAVPKNTKRG